MKAPDRSRWWFRRARIGPAIWLISALVSLGSASAFTWPWKTGAPWPRSSRAPVTPLDHPRLQDRIDRLALAPTDRFRIAVFGDQRALADGEWQELIRIIDQLDRTEAPILFLADTGDIVQNGTHADQFGMLRSILEPVHRLPYLVALGNHETHNNHSDRARMLVHTFLSRVDDSLSPETMYYRKDVGAVRFLFLDTNEFAYDPADSSRISRQLEWLEDQLADRNRSTPRTTVVLMHHPLLQTSGKHRSLAQRLWNLKHHDRRLADFLLDGGVDLILTGHTHTYERFRLRRRDDGRVLHLINLSGRPRTSFLWFGDGGRSAQDIRGREDRWFAAHDWDESGRWEIRQADLMPEAERDQMALISFDPDGGITLETCFLDPDSENGYRREASTILQ